MSLKTYFNKYHYKESYSLVERGLWFILFIPALIYKLAVIIRVQLYRLNLLKSYHPGVRVISIGNITTGGTGKTPVVIEFARYLSADPTNRIAILSRGYGKKNKNAVSIVRTEDEIIAISPEECGDEPFMMAHQLERVTILTGSSRVELAKEAANKYKCSLILLDDGFQHLPLRRNFDIVLVDAVQLFGNNKMLPLGPLREPVSAVRRAHAIIHTNKSPQAQPEASDYTPAGAPIFNADYRFAGFVRVAEKELLAQIPYTKIIAFSGIAHPEYFEQQLNELALDVINSIIYVDHKKYSPQDIQAINKTAQKHNAEAIITTEKDAVKVQEYLNMIELPLYALQMRMDFDVAGVLKKIGFYN